MAAPITPEELEALLPLATDDLCELIRKAGVFDAAMAAIYKWMFNEDGTLTEEFQTELCVACTTTTTTSTTTTIATSSTSSETTNECAYPANNIPDMTTNTAPSGVAFASAAPTADAWKAFDRDDTTAYLTSGEPLNTIAVGYQFTSPKIIRKYRVKAQGFSGENGKLVNLGLYASNNGVDYVLLDFRSGLAGTVDNSYEFSNSTFYSYYQIGFFGSVDPGFPYIWSVYSIEMYECNTTTTTTTTTSTTTTTTTTTAP